MYSLWLWQSLLLPWQHSWRQTGQSPVSWQTRAHCPWKQCWDWRWPYWPLPWGPCPPMRDRGGSSAEPGGCAGQPVCMCECEEGDVCKRGKELWWHEMWDHGNMVTQWKAGISVYNWKKTWETCKSIKIFSPHPRRAYIIWYIVKILTASTHITKKHTYIEQHKAPVAVGSGDNGGWTGGQRHILHWKILDTEKWSREMEGNESIIYIQSYTCNHSCICNIDCERIITGHARNHDYTVLARS